MSNKTIILPAVVGGIIALAFLFIGGNVAAHKIFGNKESTIVPQRDSDISNSDSYGRNSFASVSSNYSADNNYGDFRPSLTGGKRTKKRRHHKRNHRK